MESGTSAWQDFKLELGRYVAVDRDVLHVLIGLTLLACALFAVRRRFRLLPFVLALACATLLGVAMEALDLRDDRLSLGHPRWSASALDLARTVLFPTLGLTAALLYRAWRSSD